MYGDVLSRRGARACCTNAEEYGATLIAAVVANTIVTKSLTTSQAQSLPYQ